MRSTRSAVVGPPRLATPGGHTHAARGRSFFSDGGVHRNAAVEGTLRAAVDRPISCQFVGLGGRGECGVVKDFSMMPGRPVDNVGFFAVDDIDDVAEPVLYDRLLGEFRSRLRAAGVLRWRMVRRTSPAW